MQSDAQSENTCGICLANREVLAPNRTRGFRKRRHFCLNLEMSRHTMCLEYRYSTIILRQQSFKMEILVAAQEERFTRKKQDARFPIQSVTFCLKQSGLSLNKMDAIVFYGKAFLKFERFLETYYVNGPKGL